jgi:putative ABC transport system permease protein
VLLILGAAQVSARSAAWRVSRRPATEAVAESRSEPRAPAPARTAAGLLLIVGALALSTVPLLARTQLGASATPLAGILAAIGLTLAGPDLVRRTAAAAARRLPARVSAPTWLAVSNSHGYALRIAGAVTTLGMAVLFTLTYTLTQTTLADAVDADVRAAGRAQATLSAPALGGVPEDLATAVRDVPGVRAVAPVGSTTVLWPGPIDGTLESTSALILTPDAAPLLDLGIRAGGLDRLTGTTIAIDSATASTRRLSVGRTVAFVLGDGARVTAEVVAVYDRGLGFGPVVLSRDLTTGHTATATGQILIGTDGSPATTQALTALVSDQPGTELTQGTADSTGTGGGPPPEVWINLAVLAVLLGYLLLGIANKLIAATAARRTELAVLRLVGTTPRQIRAMMRREATLIVIAAVTAGGLLAAVPLALLGQSFLHRPWPAGPIWLAPVTVLVVATIALLTTELPTRQALRIPPTTELGVRG